MKEKQERWVINKERVLRRQRNEKTQLIRGEGWRKSNIRRGGGKNIEERGGLRRKQVKRTAKISKGKIKDNYNEEKDQENENSEEDGEERAPKKKEMQEERGAGM